MRGIKLNLGCANDIRTGYVNIDMYSRSPNVVEYDVRKINDASHFCGPDEYIEEIYASDIVEHLEYNDAITSVKNWCSILNTGGKLYIKTINLVELVSALENGYWDLKMFNAKLFAGKGWIDGVSRGQDFHKCAFTMHEMVRVLERQGMKIISNTTAKAEPGRQANINFEIWAEKL
jgi:hypothetical protein